MENLLDDYDFSFLNIFCSDNWIKYSAYMEHEAVYGTCGIHPMYADKYGLVVELNLRNALSNNRIACVGEIGLDFTR